MIVKTFCSGSFKTDAYLIGCEELRVAAVIDPAFESTQLCMEAAKELQFEIAAIYLTHSHFDHLVDVASLKEKSGASVWVHQQDAPNLQVPGSDGLPLPFFVQGVEPDQFFHDGMSLTLGTLKLEVLHTPGHTPGGTCLFIPAEKVLFSGDTLFKGGPGSLSFPTAEPDKMWLSLARLSKLPPSTKVFPGHGPPTTIQDEGWLKDAKSFFY